MLNSNFFLCFLLGLLPFIYWPNNFFSFEPPKVFFFVLMVLLWFLVAIWHKRQRKIKLTITDFSIIGYVVIAGVTAFFGKNHIKSFFGEEYLRQGWLFLGSLAIFYWFVKGFDAENRKRALLIMAGSAVLSVILALILPWAYAGRPVGLIGQPNFLAGFFVSVLPIIFFLTERNEKRLKIFWILGALIVVSMVMITQSRAGILALLVETSFLMVYRWRTTVARFFYLTTIVVLVFYPFLTTIQLWNQTPVVVDPRTGNYSWAPSRPYLFSKCLELIKLVPLSGVGLGNLNTEIYRVLKPTDIILPDIRINSCHNVLLDTAAAAGVGGVAAFLILIFSPLFFLGKKLQEKYDQTEKDLRPFLAASILANFVCLSFGPASALNYVYLFLMLGLW